MRTVKKINIKNRIYYFYSDMIGLKNSDARLLKVDKKSYKNIGTLVFTTLDILQLKKIMVVKIFTM